MAAPVLLAVVERDLQVVTRTVYYYARLQGIRFGEVHVLTSRLGYEHVMHRLLGSPEHPGSFERLCAHLGVPRNGIQFDATRVHTLRHVDGRPIADFREAVDLASLGDQALGVAQTLSADGDHELFLTSELLRLGFAAGLATALQMLLQCRGRFCDVDVHPLIAFEIERGQFDDFYYPQRALAVGGIVVAPEEALVGREMSFLAGLPRQVAAESGTLVGALAAQARLARWTEAPDPVLLDFTRRELRVGDETVPLAPVQFFWYAMLASHPGVRLHPDALSRMRAANHAGEPSVLVGPEGDSTQPVATVEVDLDSMRTLYQATFHRTEGVGHLLRLATRSRGYLASVISRLNATLRSQLRPHAEPYVVRGGRNRGGYWLALEPPLIRFSGFSTASSSGVRRDDDDGPASRGP